MQKLCPGPQALTSVQQKQQTVTQAWEALQLNMEQRRAQLEPAHLLLQFHTAVRTFSPWEGSTCAQMSTCTEALQFLRENKYGQKGQEQGSVVLEGLGWMMTEKPSDKDL